MPTLEINGQDVEVDDSFLSLSPEQQNATVEEIAKTLTGSNPSTSMADYGMDMLKGAGTGLVKGITSLAGTFGDAKEMTGDIIGWGADQLGASPAVRDAAVTIGKGLTFPGAFAAPTSDRLRNEVETRVTGPLPEAQTLPGQITERIGEFAPAAVAGGGTLLRRAATAAVPATASVLAGNIPGIKGTAAQPFVEAGVGLATGLPVASKIKEAGALANMQKAAPSFDEVAATKTAAYKELDKAGIVFDTNSVKSAAMKAKSDLAKLGWTAAAGGETGQMVNRINDLLKPRKVAGWTTVDKILSDAKKILRSNADDTTKNNIGVIINHFEDLVKNGKVVSRSGISAEKKNELIDTARDYARRHIIGKQIEEMKDRLPGYLAGDESAYRNQFGSYLKSKKAKSLTDAEKAAFGKVVQREGWMDYAHTAGSRLGQIASTQTGGGVGAVLGSTFGPLGIAAGYAAGNVMGAASNAGFRKLMQKVTEKAVDDAMKTVLAGKKASGEALSKQAEEDLRAAIRKALTAEAATLPTRDNWFLQDANGTTYSVPR